MVVRPLKVQYDQCVRLLTIVPAVFFQLEERALLFLFMTLAGVVGLARLDCQAARSNMQMSAS